MTALVVRRNVTLGLAEDDHEDDHLPLGVDHLEYLQAKLLIYKEYKMIIFMSIFNPFFEGTQDDQPRRILSIFNDHLQRENGRTGSTKWQ
jgi:hypothetical protein